MHEIERQVVQALFSALMFLLVGGTALAASSQFTHTLEVPANTAWVDTGLAVSIGDQVAISATGLISIECRSCPDRQTPDGQPIRRRPDDERPFIAPGLHLWSLVGRIGSSAPFEVGSEATFVSADTGTLRLSINGNSFADSSGEWRVTVKIARASAQLYVLSPFRLKAPDLTNLNLRELLPALSDISAARAVGLVADSTSTAIALWETSTRSAVTFTTTNGTSLVAYQKDFLTKAPTPGAQTLTVASSDLIRIGGTFYAAALVQAPERGANRSLADPVVINATQQVTILLSGNAFLDLKLPPILLIHGLWGDKTSLNSTRDYLAEHSPWDEDADLLLRIEYPKDLRFDSDTIAATVADGIESLLSTL